MRKQILILAGMALLASPFTAAAAVSATATSLVTSPMNLKASSAITPLFSLTLGQTAGETLSSVAVTLANTGSSAAVGSHVAAISVYKDNGNGTFEPGSDLLAGTQTTVNIGSATTVTTGANNTLDGGKFFVTLNTSGLWSGVNPQDSITANLATNAITTSANSPSISAATTSAITADTSAPALTTATANNTGGTVNKEAGDSVTLVFNQATNKPTITSANITAALALNNSHSWLDGSGALGATSWSADGTTLTITLSGNASIPTVAVGDIVNVQGSLIQDLVGNNATGSVVIGGNFTGTTTTPATPCGNGLVNGQYYFQIGKGAQIFKADNCALVASSLKEVRQVKGRKAHGLKKLKNFLKNDRWEQNNGHDNGKHKGHDRD